ncbi:hypothetical protein [Tranquillimonas alkanivorans]|uniref:hypothetical protein n=1 Tax=Tranquillimonas alkanivorans TaxID=441119 RepID=UPI000B80A3B7|nr:hypothetical protein [Tranquillimonas alkanivorans]
MAEQDGVLGGGNGNLATRRVSEKLTHQSVAAARPDRMTRQTRSPISAWASMIGCSLWPMLPAPVA